MGRRRKANEPLRDKILVSIHQDVRQWAVSLAGRRSISRLFEDLVEAEWHRYQAAARSPNPHQQPDFHFAAHPSYYRQESQQQQQ